MKITLLGIIHIMLSLLLIFYAYINRDPMILAISLSFVLIIYYEYRSFTEAVRAIDKVRIKRELEKKVSNELEEVVMKIIIENGSDVVFPRVILKDIIPQLVSSDPAKLVFNIVIPSKSSLVIEYKVKPLAPGVHDFQVFDVIISDALGYFYENVSIESKDSLVVLPLYSPTSIDVKSLQRVMGITLKGKAIGGAFELANIRDYVVGDDTRKILWKIYAKTGKLMVREDFGETRARVLVLIDMKKNLWSIGEPPNTLAQIQLRYARSLIDYLVRNRCTIDVALCSGLVPKVVRNFEERTIESLYNIISVLPVGGGCESPLSVFIDSVHHLGRVPEFYDIVILVTNPLSLVMESIDSLNSLMEAFPGRLVVTIPRYRYDEIVEEELLKNFLKSIATIVERGGIGLEISEEEMNVTYRG
ncbi:MAG: DUF58 domain-containing protein [Ignisphaera sp.]|uniref:DUF58 domain-containing protein n=1 Tax=Ignisphaera aggregans TaxID=334771 RepID=A0A7J3MXL5_9CREN